MRDMIAVDDAIRILNEAAVSDRNAIGSLIDIRIPCSDTLAAHPTIQVEKCGDGHRVGLLGILNGLFGVDERGYGQIAAIFDENPYDPKGRMVFQRFERFRRDAPPKSD